MNITPEEILHVANLARLELDKDQVDSTAKQLDTILNYVAKLNELDTSGIQPTTHAISICNAFREDVVQNSLPQEEALKNGPRQNGQSFVVPRVI